MTDDNTKPPVDIGAFRLIKNLEREATTQKSETNKVAEHFERLAKAAREGKIVEFVCVTTAPNQAVELSFEQAPDAYARHRMAINLRLAEQMVVNSIVGVLKL